MPKLHQPRHFGDVGFGRFLIIRAALSHDKGAQRAVRNLRADIDGARQALQCVEIFREALPVPLQAFGQGDAGDVLDPLHHLDQGLLVLGPHRREADAAIAEHQGRGAMPGGRRQHGIPCGLAVIVGVDIDPARRDQPSLGLDLAPAGTGLTADLDDPVAGERNVALEGGRAGAVDDGAAPDDDVVHGPSRCSEMGR